MIADVIGLGARGPVGLSSLQVAAFVRARKFESRGIAQKNRHGHEIGIGLTGGLGEHLAGFGRLLGLAAPALSEAVDDAGLSGGSEGLPVVVCLSEPGRPDDDVRYGDAFTDALGERTGIVLDRVRSRVMRRGHAGLAGAVLYAKQVLDGGAPAVVVGGVDSYYHAGVLRWLDGQFRLHGLDAEDGFIPSEAAAFLVLARGGRPNGRSYGRVLAAEVADEPGARSEDLPNIGEAMTGLVSRALALTGPVPWVITDENSEDHRQAEWEKVSLRLLHGVERTTWVWDTGEVGAASGPLFSVVMLKLAELGCAVASKALVALHADGGERGVLVLEARDG